MSDKSRARQACSEAPGLRERLAVRHQPQRAAAACAGLLFCLFLGLSLGLSVLQLRSDKQVAAIKALRLDHRLLAQRVMHPGRHEIPMFWSQDPADQILQAQALLDLRAWPGVRAVEGFERRQVELLWQDGLGAGRKLPLQVLVLPDSFFARTGLGPSSADAALANGALLLPRKLARAHGLTELNSAQLRLSRPRMGPTGGPALGQGLVAAVPQMDLLETALGLADLGLPEGLAAWENLGLVGMSHAMRNELSVHLPQLALWIELDEAADPHRLRRDLERFLTEEAPRVVTRSHLQVQSLAQAMAESWGPEDLRRLQRQLLGGGAAACLSVLAALLFLRWAALKNELALRQALGQPRSWAVWRVSRPLLLAAASGMGLALLLSLAGLRLGPPDLASAAGVVHASLLLVAVLGCALLPLALCWAARLAPMDELKREIA